MKKSRRQEQRRETREALIAAATAELAEKGIEAASLNAICDRAGYTRGAFYVHFRDRDELVAAVVERLMSDFQATLFPADGAQTELGPVIAQFIGAILARVPVAVGTAHWKFHHTLAACAGSRRIRDRYNGVQYMALDKLTAATKTSQKSKKVRRDVEPRTIAELLVVLTLGVSVANELGLEVDLAKGGAALAKLLAPV